MPMAKKKAKQTANNAMGKGKERRENGGRHQAAQAGVRASWGQGFRSYTERNINATQVLLEAAKDSKYLKRLVFASTSSVYGDAETLPTHEEICPKPVSPYGITKLAAERLCGLYYKNFGVPI